MDEMFPDWLRTLSPDDSLAQLPVAEWWKAIETFVDDATANDVVDLARLSAGHASPEFDEKWRQHLRQHDDMSPLRNQDRQIAVLAGAALIHATSSGDHRGLATYARRCIIHAGMTPELDDVALSDDDMTAAGTAVRAVPAWPVPRKPSIASSTYATNLPEDGAVPVDALRATFESFASAAADAIQRTVRSVVKTAEDRELRLTEQNDVLVWLLAGRCDSLNCNWESVSSEGAAVMAAAAAMGLSRFSIGRPDLVSLLGQAVDAAAEGLFVDTLDDRMAALADAGFGAEIGLADLQVTCAAVNSGHDVEGSALEVSLRIHDELYLQREYESK